jgi:hypothetical protein
MSMAGFLHKLCESAQAYPVGVANLATVQSLTVAVKTRAVTVALSSDKWSKPRTFTMPEGVVSMVDGRVFVKLTARHNAVRRMMTVHTTGTADESAVDKLVYTVLGRTDVIQAVAKPALASTMVDRLVPDEHHRLRQSKRTNFHSKAATR